MNDVGNLLAEAGFNRLAAVSLRPASATLD